MCLCELQRRTEQCYNPVFVIDRSFATWSPVDTIQPFCQGDQGDHDWVSMALGSNRRFGQLHVSSSVSTRSLVPCGWASAITLRVSAVGYCPVFIDEA